MRCVRRQRWHQAFNMVPRVTEAAIAGTRPSERNHSTTRDPAQPSAGQLRGNLLGGELERLVHAVAREG